MSKHRSWVFTWNNFTENNENQLKKLKTTYIMYGKEKAPTTGTPHLQGWFHLPSPRTWNGLTQRELRGISFLEPMRGSPADNNKYCSKDNVAYEKGTMPEQGERNDLAEIRKIIDNGGTMRDIMREGFNYQAIRYAEKYLTYMEKPREEKLEIKWFWGPTGQGKSHDAREECDPKEYYRQTLEKWWEGYDGQKHVVLDDFRDSWMRFDQLLRLCEGYPLRIENKGGSRQFKPTKIIITSHFPPEQCYRNIPMENKMQLIRRIDEVIEYEGNIRPVKMPVRKKKSASGTTVLNLDQNRAGTEVGGNISTDFLDSDPSDKGPPTRPHNEHIDIRKATDRLPLKRTYADFQC